MIERELLDNPSVVELAVHRHRAETVPGERDDPHQLALVIQGQGIGTAFAAGAEKALQELGLSKIFDGIIGTSGGAATAPYFAAEQVEEGMRIFYEFLTDGKFLDWKRIFKKQPPVNIDYLVYEVMRHRVPLETAKVEDSGVKISMMTTSAQEPKEHAIQVFRYGSDFLDAIALSCRIPVIAGLPIEVNGSFFVDGGTFGGNIKLKQAKKQGYTHALVIINHPLNMHQKPFPGIEDIIVKILSKKGFHQLAEHYYDGYTNANADLDILRDKEKQTEFGMNIEVIAPGKGYKSISPFEQNPQTIYKGIQTGREVVMRSFAEYDLRPRGEITIFPCASPTI